MTAKQEDYYIPNPSPWPFITAASVFSTLLGLALIINDLFFGGIFLLAGILLFTYLLFEWFGDVIEENNLGLHSKKVDSAFRQGMIWFIASEVFFFISFFASLWYIRNVSVEWLGGTGYLSATHDFLYNQFDAQWPTAGPGAVGGGFSPMEAWGIPALNTFSLLTSGATITWAHWGLKTENRKLLVGGLITTIILGLIFVVMQAWEYQDAYEHLNLTLRSGVYGSTFYILTGFHGLHVITGSIMLASILGRSIKGHFSPKSHFGFEAVAWYWHFVDVVWLALFFLVYML